MNSMDRQWSLQERLWSAWCQYCGNDIVATGLAILICHEGLFYLRQASRILSENPLSPPPRLKSGDVKRNLLAASSSHSTHLALGIDLAVEIPLIVAFHPATLLFGTNFRTAFPSTVQIALQLLVLLVVESSFRHWMFWFLPPSGGARGGGEGEASVLETPEPYFEPFSLVAEFMGPRGTILIATTVLGAPSMLTGFTGKFHVISVVAWVIVRQLQAKRSSGYGYDVRRLLGKEL